MHLVRENICSNKLTAMIVRQLMIFFLITVGNIGILILDGFLKFNHAKLHPEEAEETHKRLVKQKDFDALTFGFVPNF